MQLVAKPFTSRGFEHRERDVSVATIRKLKKQIYIFIKAIYFFLPLLLLLRRRRRVSPKANWKMRPCLHFHIIYFLKRRREFISIRILDCWPSMLIKKQIRTFFLNSHLIFLCDFDQYEFLSLSLSSIFFHFIYFDYSLYIKVFQSFNKVY